MFPSTYSILWLFSTTNEGRNRYGECFYTYLVLWCLISARWDKLTGRRQTYHVMGRASCIRNKWQLRLPLNDPPPFSGDLEWTEVNVPEYFSISRETWLTIFSYFLFIEIFIDALFPIQLHQSTLCNEYLPQTDCISLKYMMIVQYGVSSRFPLYWHLALARY